VANCLDFHQWAKGKVDDANLGGQIGWVEAVIYRPSNRARAQQIEQQGREQRPQDSAAVLRRLGASILLHGRENKRLQDPTATWNLTKDLNDVEKR
jgi:hypothetical protein